MIGQTICLSCANIYKSDQWEQERYQRSQLRCKLPSMFSVLFSVNFTLQLLLLVVTMNHNINAKH